MRSGWAMALLLWCVACGNKDAGETGGGAWSHCDRTPALTWDNFGKGYMDKHCNGCHSSIIDREQRQGAPVGIDFNTYEGVITFADRVDARATGDAPTMPPGGGPGVEEVARLEEWLACDIAMDREALASGSGSRR